MSHMAKNTEVTDVQESEPEVLDTQELENSEQLQTVDEPQEDEDTETPNEAEQEDDQPPEFELEEGFFGELSDEDNVPQLDFDAPEEIKTRWEQNWRGLKKKEQELQEQEAHVSQMRALVSAFESSSYEAEKQIDEMIQFGKQRYGSGFMSKMDNETDPWGLPIESTSKNPEFNDAILATLKQMGVEPEDLKAVTRERESQKQRTALEQHLRNNFHATKGQVAKAMPELQFTADELIKAVELVPELAKKPHLAIILAKTPEIRNLVYKQVRGDSKKPVMPNRTTAKSQGNKPATLSQLLATPINIFD